ncbi:MAG: HlyC/CorC family transporter [Catenulispora sp.]|nr:HlyC/CorC family transporter [Catenulispora sp.]
MLTVLGLVAIVALTAATGYFVSQEFTYIAVDRGRLRQLAEEGDRAAERAFQVTGRLSFMLSAAQFGITVTALLVGYVAEPLLGAGLADLIGFTGWSREARLSLSVTAALVVATVVQMVLGELLPKNVAIAKPVEVARALSGSTLVYLKVAGPVVRLFDAAAARLVRGVGIEPVEELPQGASVEDLQHIIDESHAQGVLDTELSQLLDRALGFRALTAREAMTPRVDVHTVPADAPLTRVVEMLATGNARFPVTGEDVDDLVGVVGLTEVLAVPAPQRATTRAGEVAVPALLVPAHLPLPGLLERLRAEHRQLACVVDEFGGFAGVVTLEDVTEELVGEVWDEDDIDDDTVQPRPDGWSVPARMRIDEVADATGIALPESEDYSTVSGLVLHRLGRTARVGDEIALTVRAPFSIDGPTRLAVRIRVTQVARQVPRKVLLYARPVYAATETL